MLRTRRQGRSSWIAVYPVLAALLGCKGDSQPDPGLSVADVQEAAFRGLIQEAGGRARSAGAYCLFVASERGLSDPAFNVGQQFGQSKPAVLAGSVCGGRGGPDRDPDQDTVSLHLESVDTVSGAIRVRMYYWWGGRSSAEYLCSIRYRQDKWRTTCAFQSIS